jgi:hypothetical protein
MKIFKKFTFLISNNTTNITKMSGILEKLIIACSGFCEAGWTL